MHYCINLAILATLLSVPLISVGCQHARAVTSSYPPGQMYQGGLPSAPPPVMGFAPTTPALANQTPGGLAVIPPVPAMEEGVETAGLQTSSQ